MPLARVTVLMLLSSRVLLSMLAAASELEKRGGRLRRIVREEKKRGEGGSAAGPGGRAVLEKVKRSREYRDGGRALRRLCRGSVAGTGRREGSVEAGQSAEEGEERLMPAAAGRVGERRAAWC